MKKIKFALLLLLGCITISCKSPIGDLYDTHLILVHFNNAEDKNYVVAYYKPFDTHDSLLPIHGNRLFRPCLEDKENRIPYIELDNGYLLVSRQWTEAFKDILYGTPTDSIFLITNQRWEDQDTYPNPLSRNDTTNYSPARMECFAVSPKTIDYLYYGKLIFEKDYTYGCDYMNRYHHYFVVGSCDPDSATLAEMNKDDDLINECAEMLNQIIQKGQFEEVLSSSKIFVNL